MSKNAKNARKLAAAKVMTSTRKNGGKGPAATVPKHTKKRDRCTWWRKLNNMDAKGRQSKIASNDNVDPA